MASRGCRLAGHVAVEVPMRLGGGPCPSCHCDSYHIRRPLQCVGCWWVTWSLCFSEAILMHFP